MSDVTENGVCGNCQFVGEVSEDINVGACRIHHLSRHRLVGLDWTCPLWLPQDEQEESNTKTE